MVTPMSKTIYGSVSKDTGKFNNNRLFVEKFTLHLNVKNNNPLYIQIFNKKISMEEYEKMTENISYVSDQLKEKEKYLKLKDIELKNISKENEEIKKINEDSNKNFIELKKNNEAAKIELDFFKDKSEELKHELDKLLLEKRNNKELIEQSRKNYECYLELQNKYSKLEKLINLKTDEIQKVLEVEKELNEVIKIFKNNEIKFLEERDLFNIDKFNLKEMLCDLEKQYKKLEEELKNIKLINSNLEKDKNEMIKENEIIINKLDEKLNILIKNEIKYIEMFQQISEKTKFSYDNFHKVFLDQEKKYENKIKILNEKLQNIKMKIIKKINKNFIDSQNLVLNKNDDITKSFIISQLNKFEIISKKKSNENLINPINSFSINSNYKKNSSKNLIINKEKMNSIKNLPDIISINTINKENENKIFLLEEGYKKIINELKNEIYEKITKIEKYDIERTKLVYQIQNYERYMRENEKKYQENNEKIGQTDLVINQLNSRLDIINKENLKAKKIIINKHKEELEREEKVKKDYCQQIIDLKNQLQQYKTENQGKSKIIEERNEEIRLLKN